MKIFKTVILFIFTSLTLSAQVPILRLLNTNIAPIEGDMRYDDNIGGNKGRFWIVFSDRNNNNTYKDANEQSGVMRSTNFLDRFYVIGEQGAMIKLAQGDIDPGTGMLNNLREFGWIHKRNVVLYPKCIESKQHITEKAILLNNIDTVDRSDIKSTRSINFYSEPSLVKVNGDSRLFEVFYVYKRSESAVLLGKAASISDDSDIKSNLLGWVDRKKVIFWDNRIAVEPNWEQIAVQDRNGKNVTPIVLDRKQSAVVFKTGQAVDVGHIYVDLGKGYDMRRDGYIWRYPVFEEYGKGKNGSDKDIMRVAAMGKIRDKSGKEIDPNIRANALKKYQKGRERQKNINVLFMLDATEGMKPYYSSVTKAMQNASAKLTNNDNTIRFGVVAYRDSEAGKDVTEVKPLTNKVESVVEFIDNLNTGTPIGSAGTSLYYGMKTAIQNAGLNSKHTNILVVLGREGNHSRQDKTQVLEPELVDLLAQNNCHIMAIQVSSKDEDTYEDFYYQMDDLIQKSANKRYERYKTKANTAVYPPKFDEVKAGDYQKFMLRNTAAMGQLILPNRGESINNESLTQEIQQIIINANSRVNGMLNAADKLFMGSGSGTQGDLAEFSVSVLYFIIDQAELTEEEANSFSFDDFQGSKEGYIVRQPSNLSYPLYKRVMFLDTDELTTMYERFKELDATGATPSEQRESMVRAWKNLLTRYDGYYDETLTMDQVNEKVFGLPGASPLLHNLRIDQIHDVNDTDFQRYVSNMRNKRERLLNILESKEYKFSFMSYGRRYYWIDEELLP